jgi:uncharacterized protein YutE (UPF0331/DUF86 family)
VAIKKQIEVRNRSRFDDSKELDVSALCYNEGMVNGVIAQKLQALDLALAELRSLGVVSAKQLQANWQQQRAIERNLQVLVEVVIDVCQRLLMIDGQSPATSAADAVGRVIQIGALTPDENYTRMVRLRNFIVHRYEHIDPDVLANMINRHLGDFEKFRDEVLAYVQSH